MIEAQPLKIRQILDDRDAQITTSLQYVASILGVDPPTQTKGPIATVVLADAASALNQDDRDGALAALSQIDTLPVLENTTIVGWQSDYYPNAIWQQFMKVFDTDEGIAFNPVQPSSEKVGLFQMRFDSVRVLLKKYCPDALEEFERIVSVIFVSEPKTGSFGFDGGSTFFCPEAILINVEPYRNVAQTLEVLLHEASHLLLFAYADSDGLSANDPHARFSSPLRNEPRPMEGIFHAAFVTTRVHWIMQQILKADDLSRDLREAFETEYTRLEEASTTSMGILKAHCEPTQKGREVLNALTTYWA